MDPKCTVVKSKSSNSAMSKKSEEAPGRQYNKKSRSNANFSFHGLKKRGVYVEKRLTKTNLVNNGKEVECMTKPPPRPRPGQKRFLASVLTILSKSTTGTQYPELKEEIKERKRDKNKSYSKHLNASEEDRVMKDSKNVKEKFRSRILNKKFVKEDKKKMVVLQSKKEIAQTPSNYSEWSYKDASQISNVSNLMIHEDSNNQGGINIADELKNAVLEGRNVKAKKLRYLEDEPKTLVADGPKTQKNLYNFFVDLLETTISVYNVKAEYDATAPSEASKIDLQINESVANKLNIGKTKKAVDFDDGVVSPQYNYVQNDIDYDGNFGISKPKPITIEPFKREKPIKTPKMRKVKADSFLYPNYAKAVPRKSNSVEMRRKTTFKNKNDLLNVLKQELEVDTNVFEEPKSIFQALRVMAKNKKKISFDPSLDHRYFTEECVMKRRNVISSRKVKKSNKDRVAANKNKRPIKTMFNNTDYVKNTTKQYTDYRQDDYDVDRTESYHSLEVYGFDYEPKSPKKSNFSKERDVTLTYHSSPSNSDLDFEVQDAILNPASAFSSVRKFSAVVN